MMCTTVLHGGVCHRTSTPHKSGNKMKEKKKQTIDSFMHRPGSNTILRGLTVHLPEGSNTFPRGLSPS